MGFLIIKVWAVSSVTSSVEVTFKMFVDAGQVPPDMQE